MVVPGYPLLKNIFLLVPELLAYIVYIPYEADILPNLLSSVSKLKSALFLLPDLLSIIWSLRYYEKGWVLVGEIRDRHCEQISVVLLDIPVDYLL